MKRKLCFLMVFVLIFTISVNVSASVDINSEIKGIGEKIYKDVQNPTVASIGGEWAVIGLVRSEAEISPSYYDKYYENVKNYLEECKGILHEKKYTEYSRVILALTAIGANPENVGGYNLLLPLGDFEKTTWQGVNGSIWALIALDSRNYEIPKNDNASIQATRELYVNKVLSSQNDDGGWPLNEGGTSDVDVTAMALTALSNYKEQTDIQASIQKALEYLSKLQNSTGTFSSWGMENSESCSQVIVALCSLGIGLEDSRFVKNSCTVLDGLMSFYNGDDAFNHTYDGSGANQMSTEQGLYALASLKRYNEHKTALFDMSDVKQRNIEANSQLTYGLPNKSADVMKKDIIFNKTFSDITSHYAQKEIEALAGRDIINGKSENTFDPDSTMTRAEFATIVTKSLGLNEYSINKFDDVSEGDWFYGYVGSAYKYGIITGISDTQFNPNGIITKEEAAVMIGRASKLCGIDNKYDNNSIRNILSQFYDYVKASEWSRESLVFCYDKGILSTEDIEINPKALVTRAEIAVMLYNMLDIAKLL